jgi:hypothetical protein
MKMSRCPGCSEEVYTDYKKDHPVFGDSPFAYCPFCGWTEEEGDNYKAPTKEIQLRLEGM